MRTVAGNTYKNIIFGSPVKDGRFRGNWFATGTAPSNRLTENKDKDGKATASTAQKVVNDLKGWDTFYLTNNLPYASVIEFGGYPDPVKNGTRINKSGTRKEPITPIYEKFSKSGYSKQAPNGVVRVNINRAKRLVELEARKKLPK
jgi:hypothetical protein